MGKRLSPTQREVLANVEHLRRVMHHDYVHFLQAPYRTVSGRTVDALFDADLIRTDGYDGPAMTFALTDKGQEALR